jgi:hypothetical protein
MTTHPRPPRTRRLPGRRVLVAAAVVAAVTTTGVATAYWTAPGYGSAAARTGVTEPVVLGPGTPTASIYPGGRADVALSVTNPNGGPVVARLDLDPTQGTGGFDVDSAHAACPVAAFTFHPSTTGTTIPAGNPVVSLPAAVAMDVAAPDACQGVTVTVYLRAAS